MPSPGRRALYAAAAAAVLAAAVLLSYAGPCGASHLEITSQLESYRASPDPEICERVLGGIHRHNDECGTAFDELDCG